MSGNCDNKSGNRVLNLEVGSIRLRIGKLAGGAFGSKFRGLNLGSGRRYKEPGKRIRTNLDD